LILLTSSAGEQPRSGSAPPTRDAGRYRSPCSTPRRIVLLDAFAEAGADRCLFNLEIERADEALSTLDEWAKLVQR